MSLVTDGMLRAADETEQIAYKRGAEDLREAICTLYSAINDNMNRSTMKELFSTIYIQNIVEGNTATDIIAKVKSWKEIKPGDEVEVIKDCHLNIGAKYIILPYDQQSSNWPKIYSMIDLTNFDKTWAYPNQIKKTGTVHKSLTVYFRGEENE